MKSNIYRLLGGVLLAPFLFQCRLNGRLEPLAPFDWSKIVVVPPGTNPAIKRVGNQILHFNPTNKCAADVEKAQPLVDSLFKGAQPLSSDAESLRFASDAVTLDGAYLEFGVCTGRTINFTAALNPLKKIYGFDSFQGLPEVWNKTTSKMAAGTFAYKDEQAVPAVLHNVVLYKGLIEAVLPLFVEEILGRTPVAFMFIDTDLYAPAAAALRILRNNIVDGTIVIFDEFYNYSGYEEHEFKAFQEFLTETGMSAEYLAYNAVHEQVVVRMRKGAVCAPL